MTFGQGLNSERLNRVMTSAEALAVERRSLSIDSVHVLLALLQSSDATTKKVLGNLRSEMEKRAEDYLQQQPKSTSRMVLPSVNSQELTGVVEAAAILARKENSEIEETHILLGVLQCAKIKEILNGLNISQLTEKLKSKDERGKPSLEDFAVDMVQQARDGLFDPVIGRDKEIRAVMEVLTKKIKANAMLLGEPGVGKTAIANGLAQLIASGQAPGMADCRLYNVDLGAVVAGAMYQGQFEERFKTLIKEAEESNRQIILFIDEIHMVLGAGKSQGAMNAANLLKPSLASGAIRCIGATTYGEYKQYVEKDPAFERRFVPVNVAEPSVEDTVTMLRGLRERFESFHGLNILDETLECAAEMGSRYMTGGHMPDTAITLLDAACASVKISLESEPSEVLALKSKIWAAELERESIKSDQARDTQVNNDEKLQKVEQKIEKLRERLAPIQEEYGQRMAHIIKRRKLLKKLEELKIKLGNAEREGNSTLAYDIKKFAIPDIENEIRLLGETDQKICIRPEHIAQMVSSITGIPATRLTLSENQRLLQMEARLQQRVIGQDEAIRSLSDAIIRSKAGFSRPNRPIGSFLFLGPTGVGKTQLAKSLAFEMFDDEKALVRLDMSEFLEEHSISRLIGAPPGYVGYETGGYLTEKIRNRPYSIVLIDEIEKAHKRVVNLFLQVLDDGRLTDSHGRTVDFTNTIVIMTSNIGSAQILEDSSKANILNILKGYFPPEFLNRLDGVEIFGSLQAGQLARIVDIYTNEINARMQKNQVEIALTDSAKQRVMDSAYTPEYGARPLQRYIERTITTDVSKIFLGLPENQRIMLTVTPKEEEVSVAPIFIGDTFAYYPNSAHSITTGHDDFQSRKRIAH
ncbi:ATP-dependent Clp protease ATP-binding subunit ClpB [Nematocida homosporus]|uniref:ATP-dependent Clp protease ATP-binding subunit ClpB n=1 Tax=Nematocida homosporus TaxID=1912981 RepID=UPI0022206642|nr:ATP-dependent Clp protease ATP-binding subunit ClpB [Nematocida homosporus]KAI5184724.1 ATP-dependent Clp protease ATP-binding subunit ClpB [Nematocida homosporus]